jgi:FG-GAP-like repeat
VVTNQLEQTLISNSSSLIPTNATPPELRLTSTQTNSFIGRPAVLVASDLQIVDPDGGTLPGAKVLIDDYTSGETLGISGQSGASGTITGSSPINWSFDAAEGVLTFTGSADNAAYQNALRLVTYSTTSTTPSTTPRTIQFSLGSLLSNPENGNFYEFVRFNSGDNISWTNSRTVASEKNYLGLQGYLATIISPREQAFIQTRVDGNGWIGASDETAANDWRWVTGPEGRANNGTGTPFWTGLTAAQGGAVVSGSYANWQTNEPNNQGGNESYGHIIGNANAYPNDSTAVGKWNDLPDVGGGDAFRPLGYVVEYGGLETTPLKLSASVSVNITQPTINSAVTGGNNLLWRDQNSGQNAAWRLNEATLNGSGFITPVPDKNWKMITAADFNGDGKDDALWRNETSGDNAIWLLNGLTELSTDGSSRKFITPIADASWQMITAADFNGDGRADVLWRNNVTGDNAVWFVDARNTNPQGRFITDEQFITTRVADRNWRIVGAGDFDGDGKADIAWRNETTGDNAIWLMDGKTSKAGGEKLITKLASTDWKVATVGDFDGNGKSDWFWRNAATGQNAVWSVDATRLSGQNFFTDEKFVVDENNIPVIVAGNNWRIEGAGDTNNNGKSDLIWRNFATDENAVWQMNGNIAALSGRRLVTNASGTVRTGNINWDIIDSYVA